MLVDCGKDFLPKWTTTKVTVAEEAKRISKVHTEEMSKDVLMETLNMHWNKVVINLFVDS